MGRMERRGRIGDMRCTWAGEKACVLFPASEEARYIIGVALPVDAGSCLK
jgi:hypothetical protein